MGRLRAVVAHTWRSVALAGTFVSAVAGGVTLHGDLPPLRRAAARITNDVLSGLFEGKLVIGEIESLSIGPTSRVRVRQATIVDPEGHPVIVARGIESDIRLDRLLWSIAKGAPPRVDIDEARVDDAEIILDFAPDGRLELAHALHPPPSPEPAPPPALAGAAREEDVVLHIARAEVRHARVRGNIVPPELDGDADDVLARLSLEHDVFSLEVERGKTAIRAPHLPAQIEPVRGDVKGRLSFPLETGVLTAAVDLTGTVGAIPVTAHASIDGEVVDASVDVARAEPAAVVRAFPALWVTQPMELHATAKGKLPAIAVRATLASGAASVVAEGEIDTREGHAFRLGVDAAHVDAAAIGGPITDLSGHVTGEGNLSDPPNATFRARSEAGTIAGQTVPAVALEGRYEGTKMTSTFRANEPGIDASGKLVLDLDKNDLAIDVQARSDDLTRSSRVKGASGAASIRVLGNVDLDQAAVHARVTADGERLSIGPVAAGRAHAGATLWGPVGAPILDVTASGDDVRLRAAGKEPLVYPHATGHARVAFVPSLRITDAEVSAGEVTAHADVVAVGESGVVVEGGRISGVGAPIEADVRFSGDRFHVRAKATDLDVERAAAVTGIAELRVLPKGSRATFDVDLTSDGARTDGHADVTIGGARGVAAEAHLGFAGRTVTGSARADVQGLGFVSVDRAAVELEGPPSAKTLARAAGTADIHGEIDLAQVGGALPGDVVSRVAGIATFDARLERFDRDRLRSVRGTVTTHGLEVTPAAAEGEREKTVKGVEASLHAAWDPRTDDVELALTTWDGDGLLASLDTKTRAPLAELVRAPETAFERIVHAPATASLDVPWRPLEGLPPILGTRGFIGAVSGRATLAGSLASPDVVFGVKGAGLREKRVRRRASYEPIDAVAEGRWDGEHAVMVLTADERDAPPRGAGRGGAIDEMDLAPSRPSGRVRAMMLGSVRAGDLLAARPGAPLPWSASAEVDVEHLELSPLPLPTRMRGVLTGRAKLTDLGGEPSFEANAHVDRFAISGARIQALDASIGARNGSLFASARASEGGKPTLDVTVASRALLWRGVAPGWNASELTRVDYVASGLRLSLLRSFARQAVSDLDGRLDGRGSAMFDATSQTFEGGLALSEGQLYVQALGEEITDVNAIARFERSGVFRIDDATGKVGQGTLRASAAGRMKGLQFMAANATVLIPSKQGVPLSFESVSFAEATGEVRLAAQMSEDRSTLLVDVDIPRADIELPRRETPNLQPLDPDKTIDIGIRRPGGRLETVPLEPKRRRGADGESEEIAMRFSIELGNQVVLQGKGLNVQLGGKTLVQIAEEVSVTGRVDLRGGSIEVHGRRFTVDHGTVVFPPGSDFSNPTVVAAAYWDAPDRTRVWVEFTGPLDSGDLTLRSEPAYSKNEILSILLFGRPDPNMATGGQKPSEGGQATALGSGFVATDINRALAELDENLQVETDTLSGNRTRTKVGYRVGRNLRVQVGYAPGRSYREPDTTFAFLDWQFLPKWSLLATQGNRGTSILDVLFQHRY